MKKWLFLSATALLVLALSSCLKLDENNDYIQDYVSMGTVTTGGVNPVFMLDEGLYVKPVSAMPADTFVVGERYYLHFILGDTTNHPALTYPIKFYRYGLAAIKPFVVLPKDSTDRWKDQPVDMANIWYSGHYCNLFFVSFAGIGTPNTFELVRMKESENTTANDTVPKLVFELRHNVPDYSSSYSYFRYFSFDLSSLQTEFTHAVRYQISLKWNDYQSGTTTYTRYYTPDLLYSSAALYVKQNKRSDLTPAPF
jgi:hypothetical protein